MRIDIIVIVFLFLYPVIEGIREAFMYRKAIHGLKNPINEHAIFAFERGMVFFMMGHLTNWNNIVLAVFIFPFMHDGAYYTTREYLDKGTYPYKWMDFSKTSTAVSTKFLTPINRTILFLVGVLLWMFLEGKIL